MPASIGAGTTLAVGTAVGIVVQQPDDRTAWLIAAAVAVLPLRGSLLEYMFGLGLSHDTAPWDGVVTASVLVVIGVALIVTSCVSRGAPTSDQRDAEHVA